MKTQVRPSTPDDGPAIVALMREAGLHPDATPERLHWKYWQERQDCPGMRSFVVAAGSEILAHSGMIPGACLWDGHRATVIHMLDWAASSRKVGAGVALLKYLRGLADALIGVGGSRYTRQALPLVGFRDAGATTSYVRILRPWVDAGEGAPWDWKTLPRMGRDALWAATAPRVERGPWRSVRLQGGEVQRVAPALPRPRAGMTVFERSVASISFFLQCPIARMTLHGMEKDGVLQGYYLLAFVSGQARLVDSWMTSDEPGDWKALIHCAAASARQAPGVGRLFALASDEIFGQCLRESGFHARRSDPVQILPRAGLEAVPSRLRFQMVDSDAAFLL